VAKTLSLKGQTALVVFSGGQDSTTCLYWAINRYSKVVALTFSYGQRHSIEIDQAKTIAALAGIEHQILDLSSLSQLGPNALTDSAIELKADGGYQNLPTSFVPARNLMMLTAAAGWGAVRGIFDLVIGTCQTDYSGYPDCRENFMASAQECLSLALDHPIAIHRPLMCLTKAETFELARQEGCLDQVLEHSQTCYQGDRTTRNDWGYGCGECPACQLRLKGYKEFLNTSFSLPAHMAT
jgi:7-cyano-7-deazaguanine synthase